MKSKPLKAGKSYIFTLLQIDVPPTTKLFVMHIYRRCSDNVSDPFQCRHTLSYPTPRLLALSLLMQNVCYGYIFH